MAANIINLSDTTPAAPAGAVNVKWQKGASSGVDPATGYSVFPVSANVEAMGASGAGHAQGLVPDPGATAGTTRFLCEDATFKVPAGGGGGGGSASYFTAADVPPGTANAMDDEFTGTALAAKWTSVATGVPVLTFFGGSLLQFYQPQNASDQISSIYQALPATPYTVVAKLALPVVSENYHYAGLILRDAASGRMVKLSIATVNFTVAVQNWTNPTTFSAAIGTPIALGALPWYYLKLVDDGTNLNFSYSLNGVDFYAVASEARTSWLAAPSQVGLHCGVNIVNSGTVAIFDWFRRTA